jgi:hypothetical protein
LQREAVPVGQGGTRQNEGQNQDTIRKSTKQFFMGISAQTGKAGYPHRILLTLR